MSKGATRQVYPIAEFMEVRLLSGFTSGILINRPANMIEYKTATIETHSKIQAGTNTT